MEDYNFFIFIAFIIFILNFHNANKNRIEKLQKDIKKIKNIKKINEGDKKMSIIIKELVGKTCNITVNENATEDIENAKILDVDDEWVKIEKTEIQNKNTIKSMCIIRIDDIERIDLI